MMDVLLLFEHDDFACVDTEITAFVHDDLPPISVGRIKIQLVQKTIRVTSGFIFPDSGTTWVRPLTLNQSRRDNSYDQ